MYDQFLKTNRITKGNFERKFQEIKRSLENAQFVSVDVEYTGCPRKNSTWKVDGTNDLETPEKVYANFKEDASSFIIIQLGITSFYFDSRANKYQATCYTFYVFPQPLPSVQKTFGIHGAVMELLTSLDFDFNTVVYEGISYLNQVEEENLKQDLFTNSILGQTRRPLSMEEERVIQQQCANVSKWECTAKVGDSMELTDIDYSQKLVVYLLIKKIHARFSTLWTFNIENDLDPSTPGVRIEKVSDLKRGELQSQAIKYEVYEKELIKHFVGISRIFKLLCQMKKPIISSGALFDLMIMYQQLHLPLPEKYTDFKNEVNKLFPHVYDCKHVTYEVRENCRLRGVPFNEANGLAVLDNYFVPGQGATLPSGDPAIDLSDFTNDAPPTIGQDSGWNSYFTGCCLLRMAHFLAKENKFGCDAEIQPEMTVATLFSVGIKRFKNCLHIGPATIDYICLDGPDPKSEKPLVLRLRLVSPLPFGLDAVYDDLVQYARESLRIEMLGDGQLRVTVNSRRARSEIVRRCLEFGDYKIETTAKDNTVKRSVVASGMVGVSAILLWKIYRLLA